VNLEGLHIAHPEWVHGFWLWALVVAFLVWRERRGSGSLSRLVGRTLEARLVERPARWRRGVALALQALAGFLMVVALMRPQWGEHFVATPRVGAEIMIALDVSRSMLADDAKPSRLERAKAEISDLLAYLGDDQVGLIAFAGRASILSPMTPDRSFLRLALDGAGPHSVSRGGTRLAEPILRAVAGLGEPGPAQRALILITDGEDHDSFALDAAKKAAEAGIKIITIGFGDEAGSPVFVQDPEDGSRTQVRDSDGNPVVSRLNGELLREIALATDGAYVPAGTGVLDLASIYETHIARLTRGQLDAQGRTIRGEIYQIFVAGALLCLVLGASATAFGSQRIVAGSSGEAPASSTRTRAGRTARPSSLVAIAVAVSVSVSATSLPLTAVAARAAGDPEPASSASPPMSSPPGTPSSSPADEDPRTRFNRANERLAEGDLETASTLFREARRDAVDDLELRYAASFNLGMTAVAQADELAAKSPAESLARLHEAADWFREASVMQPDESGPRHNLEVTLRRALILADEIARKGERDLETALDQLIESQRGRVGEAALLLETVARAADPGMIDALRPAFDTATTAQRELLADAEDLAERAENERAILEAKSEQARTPEEALRSAALEGVLRYLDQGGERMGQARRQLRQRSAERAYRRASEALDSLKRARDQLRDPVEQIGVLIGEVAGVGRATAILVEGEASAEAGGNLPAFLTVEGIGSESAAVEARVGELGERFTTAAERATAGKGLAASGPAPDNGEIREDLRAALTGAAPLIREAHAAMGRATTALAEKKLEQALAGDGEATVALSQAQELFFDLRELLAVSHETELRIAGIAGAQDAKAAQLRTGEESTLAAEQSRNLERAHRLESLLEAERQTELQALASPSPAAATGEESEPVPPDPAKSAAVEQRFERARTLLAEASGAMAEAGSALAGSASSIEWPRVGAPASRAAERLDALRMLFSTLLEQLERLEREQVDVSDRTQDAIALAAADRPSGERSAETRARVDAIEGDQKTLETRAGAIADALVARSEQAAAAAPEGEAPAGGSAPAGPDSKTLRRAGDHVATAQLAMQEAGETFAGEKLPLAPAAAAQTVARDELRKAIALLAPPTPEQPEEPPKQDPRSGEDESPSEGDEESEDSDAPSSELNQEQGDTKPSPEPGEDEAASTSEDEGAGPADAQDPAQLLQGVRDREAERRESNERKARHQRRSAPVEKDW